MDVKSYRARPIWEEAKRSEVSRTVYSDKVVDLPDKPKEERGRG
jgi:hypothetical protein